MCTAHLKLVVTPFIDKITQNKNSEVPFPKELFEDGLVAWPWQAGVAPQGRVLVGVLLPSGRDQQRWVRAFARSWALRRLVTDHKGHAVVGAFLQVSALGRV